MSSRRPLHRPLVPHLSNQVSTRGSPEVAGQPVNAPGAPGSLTYPDGTVYTPVEANAIKSLQSNPAFAALAPVIPAMQVLVASAIQRALDRFSIFTQVKLFDNYEVVPVPLVANTVAMIDPPNRQNGRRILFLVNPDAANAVWVNNNEGVAVNNGIPIAPNFGSHMVALAEHVHNFAVCVGNNTLMAIWYS